MCVTDHTSPPYLGVLSICASSLRLLPDTPRDPGRLSAEGTPLRPLRAALSSPGPPPAFPDSLSLTVPPHGFGPGAELGRGGRLGIRVLGSSLFCGLCSHYPPAPRV